MLCLYPNLNTMRRGCPEYIYLSNPILIGYILIHVNGTALELGILDLIILKWTVKAINDTVRFVDFRHRYDANLMRSEILWLI